MIHKIRPLLLVCSLLMLSNYVNAQIPIAWIESGTISLKQALRTPFPVSYLESAPHLLSPRMGEATGQKVATNAYRWMIHKLTIKDIKTFSPQEKELLQKSANNALATSGKINFLFDYHLLLSKRLKQMGGSAQINESDFKTHQDRLSSTRSELERFYSKELAYPLYGHSPYFLTQSSVESLILSQQPLAFVLSKEEVEIFPTLTAQQQKLFIEEHLAKSKEQLLAFLNYPIEKLSLEHFESYYKVKARWEYFSLLSNIHRLNFNEYQPSIIIRLPIKLKVDFLPDTPQGLTDAQALGKLHFYHDFYTHDNPNSSYAQALEKQLKDFIPLYDQYAIAEVLNVPYEQVLSQSLLPKKLLFKPNVVEWMNKTPVAEQLSYWETQLERVDRHMTKFRHEHPNPSLADFREYYRLHNGKFNTQRAYHQALFANSVHRK